jgi:hypothetical protein
MPNLKEQLAAADSYKRRLIALEESASKAAAEAFRSSVANFITQVNLVAINNPDMTADQVLARPDVKESLQVSLREAQDASWAAILEGAQAAAKLAESSSEAELKSLGLDDSGLDWIESSFQSSIKEDLARNYKLLSATVQQKVRDGFALPVNVEGSSNQPKAAATRRTFAASTLVERSAQALSNRAAASASSLVNRSYTDYQLLKAPPGSYKMWVANFQRANSPCLTCAALHGTTIPLQEEFDPEMSFESKPPAIYQNLLGPPRHPNCRCRIVIVRGSTPQTDSARDFAYSKILTDLLETGFTSSQVRTWPSKLFKKFKEWWRK